MINKAAEMLDKAAAAVKDRQFTYGPPNKNFANIAELWNAWLAARYEDKMMPLLDATDVSMMSILIKSARLAETPDHADSWLDIAGYAGCGLQVQPDKESSFEEAVAEAVNSAQAKRTEWTGSYAGAVGCGCDKCVARRAMAQERW